MKAAALLQASDPAAVLEVLDTIVLRTTHLVRTYALVALNRLKEARMETAKLREHDPTWTQTRDRPRFFYVDPPSLERSIQSLAAAGLPEK